MLPNKPLQLTSGMPLARQIGFTFGVENVHAQLG
jgi:hypothetical protein